MLSNTVPLLENNLDNTVQMFEKNLDDNFDKYKFERQFYCVLCDLIYKLSWSKGNYYELNFR